MTMPLSPVELASLAPAYIRSIAAYQPGKPISDVARELGINEADIVKLASNENPLGASPKAVAAIQAALGDLAMYPDGGGFALKAAISAKFQVSTAQIILGNGSNDILELAARTFMKAGDSAVYAQHAFAVYPLATQAVGATGIEVPAKDFGIDLDAMLASIRADTKMVFLANPNNPTGTFIAGHTLHAFVQQVPRDVLVVLDEAYGEYLGAAEFYDSVLWLADFPNVIISHTLSKAYGLAGLRIGFGLAHPQLIDLMNRVRQPFNVNHLAMVAAVAALGDDAFIEESRRVNDEGLSLLRTEFAKRNLQTSPAFGNFITFRVENATRVFDGLLRQGVIVRPIAGYGLPDYLRVTVGTEAQNRRFLSALDKVLVPEEN
jgi:histidinol-phosphate aminotransferase